MLTYEYLDFNLALLYGGIIYLCLAYKMLIVRYVVHNCSV